MTLENIYLMRTLKSAKLDYLNSIWKIKRLPHNTRKNRAITLTRDGTNLGLCHYINDTRGLIDARAIAYLLPKVGFRYEGYISTPPYKTTNKKDCITALEKRIALINELIIHLNK